MCHVSQEQIPFSGTFISVKYVNPLVCHDINTGHSGLKKLMFQDQGHNHAERSGGRETETMEMVSFNANIHSHSRLLRQLDFGDRTLYRLKQRAEAHGFVGNTPAEYYRGRQGDYISYQRVFLFLNNFNLLWFPKGPNPSHPPTRPRFISRNVFSCGAS